MKPLLNPLHRRGLDYGLKVSLPERLFAVGFIFKGAHEGFAV
jgi:hypothetical protein